MSPERSTSPEDQIPVLFADLGVEEGVREDAADRLFPSSSTFSRTTISNTCRPRRPSPN